MTRIDLRALVEPVLKAKLPASRREEQLFRVRAQLPVKLDRRGHLDFTVVLYVPKGETNHDYAVAVEIRRNDGVPAARIASIRRVKVDPRL